MTERASPTRPNPDEITRTDRRGLFHDTWELELLISGALVFGLLQIPARISTWWDQVSLHLAGDPRFAHFLVYYYLTLILYVLVLAFCLHIAARAYWVGLIGLRSVFPDGPDWDKLTRRGPLSVAYLRRRTPSLDRAIRLADDFCSSIFAFAFLVIGLLVLSVMVAVPIGAVVWAVKATVWPEADALLLGIAIFYATLLPSVAAGLIDRKLGARVDPDGWVALLIRATSGYGYWLMLGPLTAPISTILASRVRTRVVLPLFAGASLVVVLLFLFDTVGRSSEGPTFESFRLYPEARTDLTSTDAFYADRRDNRPRAGRLPYIQTDIVRDPYVRLFVPYYPDRDEELLDEICPDLQPFESPGPLNAAKAPDRSDLEAGLACLAARFEILLDDADVGELAWLYARDPLSGARGTVAYLPVAQLEPGRHELRLVRLFTEEAEREAREKIAHERGVSPDEIDLEALEAERVRWVIPFWI